ncbi:DUF6083 domain-containing protein [Kitasatospora sp. NPDC051914]|uniref:DUF6083 domain-containing protein n=1 Tax=Kitasatospora sp. NPDC051914 TaxID=3154945 RepID=UPI00343C2879
MPPTPCTPPGFNWDGTRKGRGPTRLLRIDPDSPSRLLRSAQLAACRSCGNPVEWCYRTDSRPLPLHPAELPTPHVPADARWNIAAGIAHPTAGGQPWCRIAHPRICPAQPVDPTRPTTPELDALRRQLAVRTRRLTDHGFTPAPPPETPGVPTPDPESAPQRPVVHFLHTDYLAPGPLHTVRCIAQTLRRTRCTNTIDTRPPAGRWVLRPADPAPTSPGHLASHLTDTLMAVYHLGHQPYGEQLRWRSQHCTVHAPSRAADVALTQWQVFDPYSHHQHIRRTLPGAAARGVE